MNFSDFSEKINYLNLARPEKISFMNQYFFTTKERKSAYCHLTF